MVVLRPGRAGEAFRRALDDPLKRWKLSPIDLQARQQYAEYTRAREDMLRATHTDHAPWTLVEFNSQKRGRLTLIRNLLDRLPDTCVPEKPSISRRWKSKPLDEHYSVIRPVMPYDAD
jgi:hypothetical protein